MSTFHPATSSLQISRVQYRRSLRVDSSFTSQDKNLSLSWHHSSSSLPAKVTLLICCQVHVLPTKALRFWRCVQFFPSLLSTLGIKHTFPCSFANKRMHLLTRVRYIISALFDFHSLHSMWPSLWKSRGYVATP